MIRHPREREENGKHKQHSSYSPSAGHQAPSARHVRVLSSQTESRVKQMTAGSGVQGDDDAAGHNVDEDEKEYVEGLTGCVTRPLFMAHEDLLALRKWMGCEDTDEVQRKHGGSREQPDDG